MKKFTLFTICLALFGKIDKQAYANDLASQEQQKFLVWSSTQDQNAINEYINFAHKNLGNHIESIDLFINRHEQPENCEANIFSIPPKKLWSKIIKPLKLIKKLEDKGIISTYKVYSSYRDPDANKCLGGAKGSKHMHNSAIDFRVEKLQDNSYENAEKLLCNFWKKSGSDLNMGLGAYGDGWFHIDLEGYRTWGHNYKGNSSMCVK